MKSSSLFVRICILFSLILVVGGCDSSPQTVTTTETATKGAVSGADNAGRLKHAILLSVDGMHAIDLANFVRRQPDSALAQLAGNGVTYTNARTPLLADSTPGLLSLVTGGSPAVTGLIYSPFYDRSLSPPGSDCSTRGTVYYVDEKWVLDTKREDSGGGIDPKKLARNPDNDCAPVYPRELLKVNTMFEVVKKAGGRTAWIDQHEMYNDLLKGHDGNALDDSRALERKGTPGTLEGSTAQDGRRLEMLLNQIRGLDSGGDNTVGVPTVFGMGFISFGMMQKSAGYTDGDATVSKELGLALQFVDESLGRIIAALKEQGLYESTLLVLSSKHGQSPIDPMKRNIVDRNVIRNAVNSVQDDLLAHATLDTIGLLWLRDATQTPAVVSNLRELMSQAGIRKIYSGEQLNLLIPTNAPRTPDIMLQSELGTFWADAIDSDKAKALLSEHGGMLDEDSNVPLVVSYAGAAQTVNRAPVHTAQVAPTILMMLGMDPNELDAVRLEHTPVLPGIVEATR